MSDKPTVDPWQLTLQDGQLFHDRKGRVRQMPQPLAPLADSHGHLTSFRVHDPARAIARAALAGVCLLVVPVDPSDDARDAGDLLERFGRWLDEARGIIADARARGLSFPTFEVAGDTVRSEDLPDHVRLIAGVHPYGAEDYLRDEAVRDALSTLLGSPLCVGVGEIGLDYTCDVPHGAQRAAMRDQLRVAAGRGLPVELHVRDARGDEAAVAHAHALEVLCQAGVPQAGCDLHCYTGNAQVMRPFAELGCYVAFGGAATFRKSDDIRAAAVACPTSQILSETDCPYMAPVPLRGDECEPAMVGFSAACVADVRAEAGVSTREETYAAFWHNARRLFSL